MTQHQYKGSTEAPAIQTADFSSSPAAVTLREIYVDDDWLEALLENLALANLSKLDCMALIDRLEDLERAERDDSWSEHAHCGSAPLVVGGQFNAEFNEYGMRSPDAMTGDNVHDTIERAVQSLASRGHGAAARQIVFFISANLDEVIDESEDE